jgi:hypothetical protein
MAVSTDQVPENNLIDIGEEVPEAELAEVQEAEEDPDQAMELIENPEEDNEVEEDQSVPRKVVLMRGWWRKYKKVCTMLRRCRRYGKKLRCRGVKKCRFVKRRNLFKKGYKFVCRRKRTCTKSKKCRWGRRTCKWVKRPNKKCRLLRRCMRARCFVIKNMGCSRYKCYGGNKKVCSPARCWTRRICKKPAMKLSYAWKACDASKGGLVSKKELRMCIPKLFKALAKCVIRKSVWLHKKLYKKSRHGLNQKQFARLMKHARWNAMRCMSKGLRRK